MPTQPGLPDRLSRGVVLGAEGNLVGLEQLGRIILLDSPFKSQ